MITRVYSLMDIKGGFFGSPFHFPSEGQAVRACTDLVADMSRLEARHPADFSLYFIGTWDDATGRFDQSQGHVHVCNLTALVPAPGELMPLEGARRANGEARL